MSKAVQAMFSEIAPRYDFLNRFLSLSIDKSWRKQAIAALQPKPNSKILDLCAGTLDLSQGLLEAYSDCQVTALDFSLKMLEAGQDKVSDSFRCQILCADGHHLPFPDQSFEGVICGFGIRNLEERQQAASEIYRVLKPGAILVVLEFFRPERSFAKLFYHTYGKILIPRLGGLLAKNREAYQYLQNSILDFFSIEEYENLLLETGFSDVESRPLSGGIAHIVVAKK